MNDKEYITFLERELDVTIQQLVALARLHTLTVSNIYGGLN